MSSPRLAVVLLAAVLATACGAQEGLQEGIDRAGAVASEVQAKVDEATSRFEDTKQQVEYCASALRVIAAVETRDYEAAVDAGQEMVARAPEAIQPQARVVLDGVVAYQDGDSQPVQSEEFQQAAEDVRRFTTDSCDPRS